MLCDLFRFVDGVLCILPLALSIAAQTWSLDDSCTSQSPRALTLTQVLKLLIFQLSREKIMILGC